MERNKECRTVQYQWAAMSLALSAGLVLCFILMGIVLTNFSIWLIVEVDLCRMEGACVSALRSVSCSIYVYVLVMKGRY